MYRRNMTNDLADMTEYDPRNTTSVVGELLISIFDATGQKCRVFPTLFQTILQRNKYIRLQALLRGLEEVGRRGLFWSKTRHVRVSTQHDMRP